MGNGVFVYDDDCGFCTWWAEFFERNADLRRVGFSELNEDLRERLPDEYESCSHLVTDGTVYSCGASIEEALLRTDFGAMARPAVELLRGVGLYRMLREWSYRRGANNRALLGKLLSKTPPTRAMGERGSNSE